MKRTRKRSASSAMTLLEVVVTVAVVGVVFAVSYTGVENVKERVSEDKLVRDVETINRAVRVYEVSGGNMANVYPHPWWVLGKLKGHVGAGDVDESTGFTGRLIDARLQPVLMTLSERQSNEPRAVWNPAERRFDVLDYNTETGVHIKGFKLTDDDWIDEIVTSYFANQTDSRDERAYNYAQDGNWVWDYEDAGTPASSPAPTAIALNSPGSPTAPGIPAGMNRLNPPTFSPAGGSYILSGYPMGVSLSNPNDPVVSQIWYSVSLGSWQLYGGTPVQVSAGSSIAAYAKSTDTANWLDSIFAQSSYTSILVQLELAVTGPAAMTWAEAGGAVQPGGPAAVPAGDGIISLANAADIPDGYENSTNFRVWWTVDGSNPMSSGTRTAGGPFSGGFGGETVETNIAQWGLQASFPIQVFAESLDPDLFLQSAVAAHGVAIDPTTLPAPSIAFGSQQAMIALDPSGGNLPVGARVYYTTDGSDPGNAGGSPTGGTLYEGPFAPPVAATITSRVYGPDGYEHWFNVSEAGAYTIPPPLPLDISVSGPASVNYGQVGGAMMAGGPAIPPAAPAAIALDNAADIPDEDESSANFTVFWTEDGSDPESSGTRLEVAAFSDGFPGQDVGIDLAKWGSGSTLDIKAAAVSNDIYAFTDSGVTGHTIAINPIALRAPVMTQAGGTVTIALNSSFGDMPVGARIYYRTDGTDPGQSGGEPASGTPYTAPFTVAGAGCSGATVMARVYAPSGYLPWFNVSPSSSVVAGTPPGALQYAYEYATSGLGGYAVFGTGSKLKLDITNVGRVTGNVGVGDGTLAEVFRFNVTGQYHKDPGASGASYIDQHVGPNVNAQNVDLDGPRLAATSVNNGIQTLTNTATYGTISTNTTISDTRPDHINVVRISEVNLGGSSKLTFSGNASSWFFVKITTKISMSGSAEIVLNGVPASQVIFSMANSSADVSLSGQAIFRGTLLSPNKKVIMSGQANLIGSVVAGQDSDLSGDSTINHGGGNFFGSSCLP